MTIAFIPSHERTLLRDSVRRSVEKDIDWAQCAEMGWLMASIPESSGGLGGDAYDLAIIAEELGRASVTEPLIEIAGVAAQALLALMPGDPRIAGIAAGALRVVLAHEEKGMDAAGVPVATRAEKSGDGFVISGRKAAIVGAAEADLLLISAMVPGDGLTLFAVKPTPQMLISHRTIDGRSAATIVLDEVALNASTLVGAPGTAASAIRRALDHALVLGSADALGAMQAAFDLTREYLLTRRQYGQRIGDFQALRHRLADMFIEIEQARSMVLRALESLAGSDENGRTRMASATKARVAQAGRFVTGQAIQLHGGIGVAEEYPLGRHFRRLLAFDLRYGSAAAHVARFAALGRGEQSRVG